jgi:hypothetical protein
MLAFASTFVIAQSMLTNNNNVGALLSFRVDCVTEYFSPSNSCPQPFNDLQLIHPVRSLACLSSVANLTGVCKSDVTNHPFAPCAAIALSKCGASANLTDPGHYWNLTDYSAMDPYSDEFVPFQASMDCLIADSTAATGSCGSFLQSVPAYQCRAETSGNGVCANISAISDVMVCLHSNALRGMISGDCATAVSNYPSSLASEEDTYQFSYHLSYYGLSANPRGDPFVVGTQAPTTMETVNRPESDGRVQVNQSSHIPAIIGGTVGGVAAVAGIVGIALYMRRKRTASNNQQPLLG